LIAVHLLNEATNEGLVNSDLGKLHAHEVYLQKIGEAMLS
jgi:hypothetical protein